MSTNEETGATAAPKGRARLEPPDLSERGGLKNGAPQRSDDRLFMQLLAFGGCRDAQAVARHLEQALSRRRAVRGPERSAWHCGAGAGRRIPITSWTSVRPVLTSGPFESLVLKPDYTMFGRTYAIGYEPDLRDTLHRSAAANGAQPGLALGRRGIRCGAAAVSLSSRPKSSAPSSPSTAPSA